MKLIVVLGIVVLAGIGWYVYQNQTEPIDHAALERTGGAVEDENESEDTMEGHDEMEEGTDNGMEFPTVDVDVDASVEARVFNVGGTNFAFDVKEIRVKEGDTVTINFVSNGGFHDWVVDEFDAATAQVNTDGTTSVTFVADKAGTYEYYCSVGNHRAQGMVGTLIVE